MKFVLPYTLELVGLAIYAAEHGLTYDDALMQLRDELRREAAYYFPRAFDTISLEV